MDRFKVIGRDGRELVCNVTLHPGDVLDSEIKARGLKKSAFAKQLGLSASQLSELLHAKRRVSEDLALRLEKLLDIEAEFWMRIQTKYNLDKKRLAYAETQQNAVVQEEEGVFKKKKKA